VIKLESVTYPPVALHIKGFTGSELKPDTITIANGEDGIPVKYILSAEERGTIDKQTTNSSSPKLLSVGNCEGCNRWRKGKRWGLDCTVCVRNVERIVDNYAV
jgi:hypothetical protein